jgi:chorismate mutase
MTTSTTGTSAPDEASATAEAEGVDAIPTLRAQIDALDAAIINLVAERAKLSTRIQTARINGGGARVQLGRERVIMDAYRAALGGNGANLADAVLQVCRGER